MVFIGHGSPSGDLQGFEPGATAFFVANVEYIADSIVQTTYLVTCRHCVVEGHLNDPFHIRFNRNPFSPGDPPMTIQQAKQKSRTATGLLCHVENPEWHFHPDENVDLAVMIFDPPSEADTLRFPIRAILTGDRLLFGDIGPGDLTYTVGLFRYLSGKGKNIALVHSGHIAAFPEDELVPVRDWYDPNGTNLRDIEAYIVQCQALEGASGSPVFVRKAVRAAHLEHVHDERTGRAEARDPIPPSGYGALFLLGIWQGSWELPGVSMNRGKPVRSPSGYGVVVPTTKLLEILNMPKFKDKHEEKRRKAIEAKEASFPVADSAFSKPEVEKEATQTLKRMLETPPQPRIQRVTDK